ncbi:immunoglobulin lambda-1 light chain-like isoform X2 [Kryptolebias marmoratus]|nr:immunoglobulin lambda-1 light chain-like isoform X2 [Kryptolebias marmoratus]
MLLLPAAALCCLCSALVAMAAELVQDKVTLTSMEGRTVSIGCKGFEICNTNFVYWYQKKDSNLVVLIRVDRSGEKKTSHFSHPQKGSFSDMVQDGVSLVIKDITAAHSATYYCVCHKSASEGSDDSNYLIFGTGTKLYVNGGAVQKPSVSLVPAASGADLQVGNGRSSLLCLASGMFPPEVRFIWTRGKNDQMKEWAENRGEQLELRKSKLIASILVVDPRDAYKYSCSVKHEENIVKSETKIEVSPPRPPPRPGYWFKQRLLLLMYSLLIVKSLVYCCGLSVLRSCRSRGAATK